MRSDFNNIKDVTKFAEDLTNILKQHKKYEELTVAVLGFSTLRFATMGEYYSEFEIVLKEVLRKCKKDLPKEYIKSIKSLIKLINKFWE